MGAREKLNYAHLLGVAVVLSIAGLLFESVEIAVLLGVLMTAALIAGGDIRLTPEPPPGRSRPTRRRSR